MKIFCWIICALMIVSVTFAESTLSVLWEKEITEAGRAVNPLTVEVDEQRNTIRVIGVSYIYRRKETPRLKDPNLFEYRFDLNDHTSQTKSLLTMDANDITLALPQANTLDSQIIKGNIVILRDQYKSHDFQELTIGNDWKVKSRPIPGLTRSSVSTLGACRNMNGEVFLCGNSGYIRKIQSDGAVSWDTNYNSDQGEYNSTLGVAYSESEKMLVAFGASFEPDTKFTTKSSSLWLVNLDSKGNFRAKAEFEGVANLGKMPTFCLSTSDHPIVLYDNNTKVASNLITGNHSIYVSKFSKNLSTKEWTTQIFDGKDLLISRMFLTPFGEDSVLAVFDSINVKESTNSGNLHIYMLNKDGNIINQADFQSIEETCSLVTVINDKIFFVMTQGHPFKDAKAKLICCKIIP